MAAKRELTMRQTRQILRLAGDGVSAREMGRMLGVARSTIQDNLKRAEAAGLAWPLPAELNDAVLEERLFARAGVKRCFCRRAEPDWTALACELKRPGVNLMLLWQEYREVHREGYGYSRFCELFREFEARLSPVMRQDHAAGDKVFATIPTRRSVSSTARPALFARPRSSSACLAPRALPTPRRPGRRGCRTGPIFGRTPRCSPWSTGCELDAFLAGASYRNLRHGL